MDYNVWKQEFEQTENPGEFIASHRKTSETFFPNYVQERLDSSKGLRVFDFQTQDYCFKFYEDLGGEFKPELRIQTRGTRTSSRTYEGSVDELARQTVKVAGRKGTSKLVFNTVPEKISHALSKSEDFWYNFFSPITSRINHFIDNCLE